MRTRTAIALMISAMLVLAGCGGGQDGGDTGTDGGGGETPAEKEDTSDKTSSDGSSSNVVESAGDNWVQVDGTVVVEGEKPGTVEEKPKAECDLPEGQNKIVIEKASVGKNGGVAEVFVWLEPKSGTNFKVLKSALPPSEVTIDQKGCRFHPENAIIHNKGVLTVKNSDKGSHNFNYQGTFLSDNIDQVAGATDTISDLPSKPQFISFKCDIHAWMGGLLRVADHHAYALTGEGGSFDLGKVVPGKYTLNLRHEMLDEAKTIDVTVNEDGSVEGVDLSTVSLTLVQ